MNEFKYQITQFIFLVLLGLGAYWALTHLDTGVDYRRDQIVEDIQADADPKPNQVVSAVNNEIVLIAGDSSQSDESPLLEEESPEPEEEISQDSDLQKLAMDLKELLANDVTMNSGASGSRVGVIQKFLEFYFKDKNIVIDNDFGPATKRLVKEFQQKELNGGDGRVGPNTITKMIEIVEK